VEDNRAAAARLVGCTEAVWLDHVHGSDVVVVDHPVPAGTRADGCVTTTPGLALAAMGADCAPIAIANDSACAAVHSGWRGLAAGVVERGVEAVRSAGSGRVHAVIGPCICVSCYEFGADDLQTVARAVGSEVVGSTRDGQPSLDLPAGICAALERAGVESIEDLGICTMESRDHYSFRRDATTGRQAVVVALR
jgi:YfiH family protein